MAAKASAQTIAREILALLRSEAGSAGARESLEQILADIRDELPAALADNQTAHQATHLGAAIDALTGVVDLGAAGGLTLADVALSRGAANRLDLATGDSFRLVSGALELGADVSLSRGAANRLDLADGDSFSLPAASGGQILAADAAEGAPSYAFTSAPTTGWFLNGGVITVAVASGKRVSMTNAGVHITDDLLGHATTPGIFLLTIRNGVPPVGTIVDSGSLYVDTAVDEELFYIDSAGNAAQIS